MRLIIFISLIFSLNVWSQCPSNLALKAQGFKIDTQKFYQSYSEAQRWIDQSDYQFEDDLSGTIYSSVASQMVTIKSLDYLPTARPEMFGDVVFMKTFRGSTPVEVRWYKNGQKYLSYNIQVQECATNSIPYAGNALL